MPRSKAQQRGANERVRTYRERMRLRGLRPIQIWVPDIQAAGFAEEALRQSRAVAQNSGETDDQAFIDAAADPL